MSMYAEERQQAMARLITERRRLSVADLAREYDVTTETVRRDLSQLERLGLVRRVHGGAVPADVLTPIEAGLGERDRTNADLKDLIAKAALSQLPPDGATVILDAGTTTARLAAALPTDTRLTVFTHSVPVASRLLSLPRVELRLLPGRVRHTTQAAVGPDTVASLDRLRADVAFVGTNALSRGSRPLDAGRRRGSHQDRARRGRTARRRPRRLEQGGARVRGAVRAPRRHRLPGHRRRPPLRRPPGAREGGPRGRGRMRTPSIVTLTPNPSIDRTITLAAPLVRGAVQRTASALSQAGGKGVNISRACLAAGVPTTAVLPAAPDDPFVLELTAAAIPSRLVAPDGAVRVNLTISEPDGTTTKLNSPGAAASSATLDALAAALRDLADGADWLVLAGSLPPGAPDGWYADLVTDLRASTRVAVDTSDAPLRALVERLGTDPQAAPHVLKPNGEELASVSGRDAAELEADPAAAAAAARTLVDRGVHDVLATLGGHGAVLVTAEGAWHATPPPTEVVSTVGAGDSSLFGYLLGYLRGQDPAHRLALAVAYGSAAAGLPGTTIPQPTQVRPDLVDVRALPLPLESQR